VERLDVCDVKPVLQLQPIHRRTDPVCCRHNVEPNHSHRAKLRAFTAHSNLPPIIDGDGLSRTLCTVIENLRVLIHHCAAQLHLAAIAHKTKATGAPPTDAAASNAGRVGVWGLQQARC
jgi:hypothetical protein